MVEQFHGKEEVTGSTPVVSTTNKTLELPSNHTYNTLWETFEQLKRTEKLLKGLDLFNEKYLIKRNEIYYFVLKVDNQVYKKSLKTSNKTYAIILRQKILERIGNMEKFKINNGCYQIIKTSGSITLIPENETETKLLDEIENTLNSKIKRLKTNYPEIINKDISTRNKITLRKASEEFIQFKIDTGLSEKQVMKYKQAMNYLIVYFGENKNIRDITGNNANEFRSFLFKVPKNYTQKAEFKNKDIKLLIEKKSSILDKFDKQNISTVEEVIKKVKSMFIDFENRGYTLKNPFNSLTKISKNNSNNSSDWLEFKEEYLIDIFSYCLENDFDEAYNFLKFSLYTGLRRGEVLLLKIKDIDFEKSFIDIDGTKTDNAKRIMVIHKDLTETLQNQLIEKSNNDYLFFNSDKLPDGSMLNIKYRDEKVGAFINDIIGIIIPEELKKHYNIHSLRKNFTQTIYLSNFFGDLEIKTLLGHSTKGDVTDNHYIRGKRDYQSLKEKMDKVDFSMFLPK